MNLELANTLRLLVAGLAIVLRLAEVVEVHLFSKGEISGLGEETLLVKKSKHTQVLVRVRNGKEKEGKVRERQKEAER